MSEIVVGVDESDGAAAALRWAMREGELRQWQVTAVLAWGYLDQHPVLGNDVFDPQYDAADAREALEKIVANALGHRPGNLRLRVVCDLAARALLEASAGSELLVVGARGLGGFRRLLLGSVSQHCLHHAAGPIAIVRTAEGDRPRAERIVAAVDGSETSHRALRWALEEATLRGAPIDVVHAWNPPPPSAFGVAGAMPWAGSEETSRSVIDRALAEVGIDSALRLNRLSAQGTPASVILDAAAGASLVVMGSRGLGGFKGMLLGSVANQVTHHAPCPVVVIPPPESAA